MTLDSQVEHIMTHEPFPVQGIVSSFYPYFTAQPRQVTVTDVNDNPPFLSDPKEGVEVEENGGAKVVARVKLGDADDWRLGHGPPFSLALDPQAPTHVSSLVKVEFDPSE